MKKSRFLAILLCLVMLLAFVACGDNSSTKNSSTPPTNSGTSPNSSTSPENSASPATNTPPAGSTRDTLNIAMTSDAGTLNPALMTRGLYDAIQVIYEPLWELTEDGEIIYVLAESVEEVSPTQWTVKLREGVTFSNGNPFTASDVIFSLNYWKGVGVNAVRVQSMDAENTKAIDDYTIDLRMTDFYVMNWSACSLFTIYDEESFDEVAIVLNPIGTGAYEVKEYITNSHLILEARDDYWGAAPDIKTLNFRIMAEPSQVVNALTTGTIDVATDLSLADYDYVSSLSNYNIDSRYVGGGRTIGFNSGKKSFFNRYDDPVKSLEARYAVIHAIDPQVIIDIVYEGQGKVMKNIVPELCLDYQPEYAGMHSTYAIGYDVELAKQYAESSGLAGQTISMMTDGQFDRVQTAELIQDMLAQIDVTLEINNYDPATTNTMQYDPEATHDMSTANGIAPNRRTCDLMVNGVRYSPVLSAPGAFPNNEYYLEIAPLTIHTPDETRRLEYVWEVLTMYVENALGFGLCEVKQSQVFPADIDMNSLVRGICNGNIRYMDLKVVS